MIGSGECGGARKRCVRVVTAETYCARKCIDQVAVRVHRGYRGCDGDACGGSVGLSCNLKHSCLRLGRHPYITIQTCEGGEVLQTYGLHTCSDKRECERRYAAVAGRKRIVRCWKHRARITAVKRNESEVVCIRISPGVKRGEFHRHRGTRDRVR